jgi:hypothetical protein
MSGAICSVEGCDRAFHARGWCHLHYQRWQRHGEPGQAELLRGNPQHGTANMYHNYHCRCEACTAAWAAYHRAKMHRLGYHRPQQVVFAERRAAALARDNHGTESRYRLGCRCDECRSAASRMRQVRRQRKMVAA